MQGYKYDAQLLSRASFPATLDADGRACTVEVTVYRLNAAAVTSFMLDGFDPFLRFIGLEGTDTYITRHEVEDIVTVVHVIKETSEDDQPQSDGCWQWTDGMHIVNGELEIKPNQAPPTCATKEREPKESQETHKEVEQ